MNLVIVEEDMSLEDPERDFLVIGYYTVDTPYEREKESLKLTLEALGYDYDFIGVEHQGSWQKNTQLKSKVIQHFLDKYCNRHLLYLDVDSLVIQKLTVLETIHADIAAVHFANGNELLSGTVYFGGTQACRRVVEEWQQINDRYPDILPDKRVAWDQRTLELAIKKTKCLYVELPQAYTWIAQLTQKKCEPGLAPIIVHTRGAYRFKHQINAKKMK